MRFWLEDKLRPPRAANPIGRDWLSVALLLILASVLVPAWNSASTNFLHMFAGQMASYLLLIAMGFMLALRAGAIDLSVWSAAGLGGLAAAWLINLGLRPDMAILLAVGAGLGLGVLNGAVVLLGCPSVLATTVTGVITMAALQRVVPGRSVWVPETAFDALMSGDSGVLGLRVLLVTGLYVIVAFSQARVDLADWKGRPTPRRLGVLASLAASGMLAAAGGACFLIDNGWTPVPTRLIDDLRVPAAAILAGTLFLDRKGRQLLCVASLPPALLLSTIWRQKVWYLPAPTVGLELQMLVLVGMAITVHLAFGRYLDARGTGRRLPSASVFLAVGGLATVAAAGNFDRFAARDIFHAAGIAVWLAGTAMVVASIRYEPRPIAGEAAAGYQTVDGAGKT